MFFFLPRTACRRGTPGTSPTRTKLAENLWNIFERLRATWISVEPRNLLVTPVNVSKNWYQVVKMLPIFGTGRKA